MLGLRWLCKHLSLNLINRTTDIQEKSKTVKICVQSQWRVVLLWCHSFWQSSIQRGRHTKLCIIRSLMKDIQSCSKLYCWVSTVFYSPNPHCCLRKLPLYVTSYVINDFRYRAQVSQHYCIMHNTTSASLKKGNPVLIYNFSKCKGIFRSRFEGTSAIK